MRHSRLSLWVTFAVPESQIEPTAIARMADRLRSLQADLQRHCHLPPSASPAQGLTRVPLESERRAYTLAIKDFIVHDREILSSNW
jgi:hypothetical protein